MLKLSKRHGSKFWTARGTYCGIKIDRSLKTSDKREAEAILANIQKEIFDGASGRVSSKGPTFSEAVITYCKRGGERRFLEPLVRYFGDLPILSVDQAAIDAAATAIYPDAAPATRNRQVYTPISAVLKSAGLKVPVSRLKNPKGKTRWIRHDEAARLLAACSPHMGPLVMFMFMTGARAGEALWLDWCDVDLARGHVSFTKTKNGESRGVPLHQDLIAELANIPERAGFVFRKPNGEPYPLPTSDWDRSAGSKIKTAFHGACARAGIENFRVHDCRHTWATWHYQAHRDLKALQVLGGWKTLSMVTRYAHSNVEDYRKGIEAMPSLTVWADHGQKISPSKIHYRNQQVQ